MIKKVHTLIVKSILMTGDNPHAASHIARIAAIILAMTGILSTIVGALVHNIGSVAVIINSALLLRFKSR